jgi:NCAIR mutase (PurE)-related protein
MKDVESFIEEAISNIRDDRALASKLLIQIMNEITVDASKHERSGIVAAKYLETLQRSNEQLVKISALIHKNSASTKLTDHDKEEIYDLIKGEE